MSSYARRGVAGRVVIARDDDIERIAGYARVAALPDGIEAAGRVVIARDDDLERMRALPASASQALRPAAFAGS